MAILVCSAVLINLVKFLIVFTISMKKWWFLRKKRLAKMRIMEAKMQLKQNALKMKEIYSDPKNITRHYDHNSVVLDIDVEQAMASKYRLSSWISLNQASNEVSDSRMNIIDQEFLEYQKQ